MDGQFKYIYKGQELSKEEFTAITKDMFKWFENNTINAVDYSSVSNFLGENYKSKGEINSHLKGVLDGLSYEDEGKDLSEIEKRMWNMLNPNLVVNNTEKNKIKLEELKDKVINDNTNYPKQLTDVINIITSKKIEDVKEIMKDLNSPKEQLIVESFPLGYVDISKFAMLELDDKKRLNQKFVEAGEKHNKLKAPLDILQTRQFSKALQLLALATSYGNHKYKDTDLDFLNFKRVEGGSQTYLDASARHSTDRDNLDSESGLHHFIHGVWNQLAALEIWAEENKINIEKYSKDYLENLQNKK